ncbi:MAG: hypothetical protein U1U88_001098 [Lawsonella clevelandensis]
MTIQNRILAATTTALLILTGASALATADTIPEGPLAPTIPSPKTPKTSAGAKDIPHQQPSPPRNERRQTAPMHHRPSR